MYKGIDIFVLYLVEILHDSRELHVVDVIAQYLLKSNLVTVGHSDVVHLVTETDDEAILSISNSGADTLPNSDMLECLLIFPVADDSLTRLAQTRKDMSELAVAVSTLIEVHKIHVDGIPWNLFVVLSM